MARPRWQFDQNQFTDAINTLTTFLKQEPGSPALTEARSLLHRAQLESALDLAAVERAHYDPAKALAALDAITKEPFDSFVATAALAEADHVLLLKSDELSLLGAAVANDWRNEAPRTVRPQQSRLKSFGCFENFIMTLMLTFATVCGLRFLSIVVFLLSIPDLH